MQEKLHYPLQSKNWTINTFSYPWELRDSNGDINLDILIVQSTVTEYESLRLSLTNGGDISAVTDEDINKFHVLSIANRYIYENYEKIKNKKEFDYPKVWDDTNSVFIQQNIHSFLNHSGTAGNLTVIQIPWQNRGHRIKRGSISFVKCLNKSYDTGTIASVTDDELGNLSFQYGNDQIIIGHVDYDQGLIVVWDVLWNYVEADATVLFSWSSDLEVTTFECLVNVKTNILHSSFNKTWGNMLTANSDANNNFPSGWDPFPHLTTIGLYNDTGELLMVAKLASPIKRTNTIDQLIHIRHDF